MTWLGGWAVTGGTNSAAEARLMLQASTRASQGVVEATDLKVAATSTPSSSVEVAAGACIILGVEVNFQGSYSGVNAGTDMLAVPASGGSATHHLIVARAEDPTFSGSPWTTDLESGEPVVKAVLIPSVAAGTTAVPAGTSGIPLARIDLPSSTSTVTDAMIVDLRGMVDARQERHLLVQTPTALSTDIGGTSGTFTNFSTAAGWSVTVPTWASQVVISLSAGQIRYNTGVFFGALRATFGSSLAVQSVNLDDNTTGTRRNTAVLGDTLTIPDAYRGTSQTLRFQACGLSGNAGFIGVDGASTLVADVVFLEAPR